MRSSSGIYLDYAASTPVDPRVFRVMEPYFGRSFGNPGSVHSFGQKAIAAVDAAREGIARGIGADFREVIFTGSATEANNLALRGAIAESRRFCVLPRSVRESPRPRLVISAVEHESVRETARDLEREGVEIVEIPVNRLGFMDIKKFKAALNERTILTSIIYANNEIGTIQPIAEIGKIMRNFREDFRIKNKELRATSSIHNSAFARPLFHVDAVQAFQFLPCNVAELGVDLMTLSAHKIYGPKGIGALYARQHTAYGKGQIAKKTISNTPYAISPITTGGGQEFGLRSGTENVPLIAGFGKSVELAEKFRGREAARLGALRDYFWQGFLKRYPEAELNAPSLKERGRFLPNILNIFTPRHEAEHLVAAFDLASIAISAGSACKSRALRPSHAIEALGFSKERAERSVRVSLGRPTTKGDIDLALKRITMIFAT